MKRSFQLVNRRRRIPAISNWFQYTRASVVWQLIARFDRLTPRRLFYRGRKPGRMKRRFKAEIRAVLRIHESQSPSDRMKMELPDPIAARCVDELLRLFPQCATELRDEKGVSRRAVDFEELRRLLGDAVAEEPERYEFNWVGKRAALADAYAPTRKTLRPCPEESVDWDSTGNLYIEGDNLDALKLLQAEYRNKVKTIYIDPPYNTGSDSFLYADDFRIDGEEYARRSGRRAASGLGRFRDDETIDPRRHVDWCSMIFSRLILARELLTDDGAIFISISDVEFANLRKICDEVFGEKRFIAVLNWNTKKAAQGMATAHMIVENHEYIVVYAKNPALFRFKGIERDAADGFSNPDGDPRGVWKRQYLQRLGQGLPVRMVVDPATGRAFSFETPYTQEKLNRWTEEGRIIFPSDPTKYPARKEFLAEYKNRRQLVTSLGLFPTKATTEQLYALFSDVKIFTNPKPEALVRFLLEQTTKDDDLVLDFFSGSATTAAAVMRLNAADGGRRRFIMVQIPEECGAKTEARKAGYVDVCEIGKERIRRAGAKLRAELDAQGVAPTTPDVGFRVYKLVDPTP